MRYSIKAVCIDDFNPFLVGEMVDVVVFTNSRISNNNYIIRDLNNKKINSIVGKDIFSKCFQKLSDFRNQK
jgi:hypothetical protein